MSSKVKVDINTLTQNEYVKLIAKMREAKVSAIVLFADTFVLSENGAVSVLGSNGFMTAAQQSMFKLWLVMKYGHSLNRGGE